MRFISSQVKLFSTLFLLVFLNISCLGNFIIYDGNDSVKNLLPIKALVVIKYSAMISSDILPGEKGEKLKSQKIAWGGSGSIHKSDENGSYIITAQHVCEYNDMLVTFGILKISDISIKVKSYDNRVFDASVVASDVKNDICILQVKGLKKYHRTRLAKNGPEVGDRIYNVAAPKLITEKEFAMIYEGFYAGKKMKKAWYSNFSVGGSSGSMLLNARGEMIGIVTHTINGVICSLGPQFKIFRDFITKNIP